MPKRFNRLIPKTLAVQILLVMLVSAIVPLGVLGWLGIQTTRSHFDAYASSQARLVERNYVEIYQSYLQEQVNAIDAEMKEVEHAVQSAVWEGKAIFSDRKRYSVPPLSFTEGQQWALLDERGNEAVSILTDDGTLSQPVLQDMALSQYLHPLFSGEIRRNPNIVAMYYIHPKGTTYYFGSPSAKGNPLNASADAPTTAYSFYRDALSILPGEEKVAWTKPYLDITPNGRMFTATAPIYDGQGQLKGVVAADVTIDAFVRHVLDVRFREPGAYAFLLDTDRKLMAVQHAGYKEIGGLDLQTFFELEQEGGYREAKVDGQADMLFGGSVPSTGWLLGYVVPKERLLYSVSRSSSELTEKTGSRLFSQLTLISVVSAAICFTLAVFLWLRISKPLKMLKGAFHEMGSGQFQIELREPRTREFDQLMQTFNRMSARIGELMDEQVRLNEDLEHKVEERTVELNRANTELRDRVGELVQMENWRKKWFTHISHDLKTPAAVAKGFIDAILDGKIPDDQTGKYLIKVTERIQTINRLVRDLNDLSLLETGQIRIQPERHDAGPFFRRLIAKWTDPISLGGRAIIVEENGQSAQILADPHYIGRAVNNIIENAVKYSPSDSTVTVSIDHEPDRVVFRVIDQGAGIPAESLPYVFDSFYRVDKSRNSSIPGSGLGLSIAREIVRLHGGDIGVELNAGHGCTFLIALPVDGSEEA
ncbi:sensor histidine kinase [Paenibacillus beijingensis]|uniref:histidine kinase n=1 Tax=Paenibacillus beijingensis TaxID=1126833 RepID=A0A0D5NJM3_9BACL|nr:sensor histidine kinase [Paenibacillus beijingensis]AJY75471.1 hypothetical protein VN24_13950 [Paenibacillus beijingensis]